MEENPNACNNPIAATNIPSNSSSSHFITVAMRDRSKLTDKTMHSRSRRTKRGFQFPRKVASVFFSSAFGKKKSVSKKDEDHSDSESLLLGRSDSQDVKEKHLTAEGNDLVVHGNQRIVGPLSQLIKLELENAVDPHDDAEEEGKNKNAVLRLARFVDENKSYNGEGARERRDVVSSWGLWRIKVSSWRLVRVASRIVGVTSWVRKKVREEVEDDRERGKEDEEACLCKKRILMGGRCKPLYSSGALQYDSDGILIPDQFP